MAKLAGKLGSARKIRLCRGRVLPAGVRAVPLARPVVAPWVGLATPAGPAVAPVAAALRASLRGVDVARELLGAEA